MTMNVYMLKTSFAPETLGEPKAVQQQIAEKLSSALASRGLKGEFSRVSQPYPEKNMAMAVVCSELAADELRAMSQELGIDSLSFHEDRTRNLQAAQLRLKR